jgi:hypothetical protein
MPPNRDCLNGDFLPFLRQSRQKLGKGSLSCAGIFKQSVGTRKRVGIGLSYRPARLHRLLAEFDSLDSIPGLLKSLKIRALVQSHPMWWKGVEIRGRVINCQAIFSPSNPSSNTSN